MRLLSLCLLCLSLSFHAHAEKSPAVDKERVIFETQWGDLVFALYPEVAPKHTAQIKKLVSLGAYDGTRFFRVEPNFVLQLATIHDRLTPLNKEQKQAEKPIQAEFSKTLQHAKGILSMARWDDPNSAKSSFSIVLGTGASHLDGQYTIFGHLESGADAINKMIAYDRNNRNAPVERLTVDRARLEPKIKKYYKKNKPTPANLIDNSKAGKIVQPRPKAPPASAAQDEEEE